MTFNIQDALEVRTALDARSANELIQEGWKLLDTSTGRDESGYPLTYFVLARFQ